MPTFNDALQDAWVNNPSNEVILHTLELRHPSFQDDTGNEVAVRIVRNNEAITARLEESASLNGGELVEFIPLGFDFKLPSTNNQPVPEIDIQIDNVSREIGEHLDQAAESSFPVRVIYRPYLSTMLTSGPQMTPVLELTLSDADLTNSAVIAKARILDLGNKAFPSETYTVKRFPGLNR